MKKALIGYGGHAQEVMSQMGQKLICFVDDEYVEGNTKSLSEFDPEKYIVMVAIADPRIRFDMVNKLPKNTKYFSWIHPTVIIIGKHGLLNRGNHIGHDCKIGNYFSMMPGSIVSGNVKIHDCVYMGTNSSIKEKTSIHSLVTIGMGSAVIKNINESGTYVGVPSKKIK
jgi:acetyltransferase-like isoleucine patch superfamily enzyme